uniref:Uncharacterized protein n=1 Tax=Arundo donax TaxID=35708 RepID=A0A0A8YZU3_ARUDO
MGWQPELHFWQWRSHEGEKKGKNKALAACASGKVGKEAARLGGGAATAGVR